MPSYRTGAHYCSIHGVISAVATYRCASVHLASHMPRKQAEAQTDQMTPHAMHSSMKDSIALE